MPQKAQRLGACTLDDPCRGLCLFAGKMLVVCSGAWQGATEISPALLHSALVGEPGREGGWNMPRRPGHAVRAQGSSGTAGEVPQNCAAIPRDGFWACGRSLKSIKGR